ncbi:MAG: DUF2877 domain-containing protein, partial [Coriobacteriales bacterium]|nr:DUF2877 domain-containing protein [Coriobacteriales bacterium]
MLSVGENISARTAQLSGGSLDGLGLEVGQPCRLGANKAMIGPVRLDLSHSMTWEQKLHYDGHAPHTGHAPCSAEVADYYGERIKALAPAALAPRHIDPETILKLGYAKSAAAAARRLIGLGMGLTPAGDDIVLGALVAARHLTADAALVSALEDAIAARAQTTSALSRQMLVDAL